MKTLHTFYVMCLGALIFIPDVAGYNQPGLDLGQTNILDSGTHQTRNGWLFELDNQYYFANKFLDANGAVLEAFRLTDLSYFVTTANFFYQSNIKIINTRLSFSATIPMVFYLHLSPNTLGLQDSGSGLGDVALDVGFLFDSLYHHSRQIFSHKLEFDVSFPTGKNEQPEKFVNAGNGFFFIDPSWAATLYLTDYWALSWRLYYVWNAKNPKTGIKAGDAMFINFDMDLKVTKRLWVAVTGYFLQQLTNDTLNGASIPFSRERVLGMGPGARYTISNKLDFYNYLYVESNARNRTQGINFVSRLLLVF